MKRTVIDANTYSRLHWRNPTSLTTSALFAGASYRLSTCFRTRSARPGDAALAVLVPPGGRVAALALGAGRCERRPGVPPERARTAGERGGPSTGLPAGEADRGGARSAPGPGGRAGDVGAAADGRVSALGSRDADGAAADGGRVVRDPPAAGDSGEQRQPAGAFGEHLRPGARGPATGADACRRRRARRRAASTWSARASAKSTRTRT